VASPPTPRGPCPTALDAQKRRLHNAAEARVCPVEQTLERSEAGSKRKAGAPGRSGRRGKDAGGARWRRTGMVAALVAAAKWNRWGTCIRTHVPVEPLLDAAQVEHVSTRQRNALLRSCPTSHTSSPPNVYRAEPRFRSEKDASHDALHHCRVRIPITIHTYISLNHPQVLPRGVARRRRATRRKTAASP
jgi:hypothetical protein